MGGILINAGGRKFSGPQISSGSLLTVVIELNINMELCINTIEFFLNNAEFITAKCQFLVC